LKEDINLINLAYFDRMQLKDKTDCDCFCRFHYLIGCYLLETWNIHFWSVYFHIDT